MTDFNRIAHLLGGTVLESGDRVAVHTEGGGKYSISAKRDGSIHVQGGIRDRSGGLRWINDTLRSAGYTIAI